MSEKIQKLIEEIKGISVLELAELVKALEEEFGVSAAAPVAVAAAAPVAAAAEEEEKTEFEVVLKEAGAEKLKVVKVVRELTGLALKEAKDLVDNAPSTIRDSANKEEAANMKAKIEEVGGKVEIK